MFAVANIIATALVTALVTLPARAQNVAVDRCLALASNSKQNARIQPVALKPHQVRITYNGHSTFTIESPKGVTVTTDYNDIVGPSFTPVIVTMNVAHSTYYTTRPSKGIKHVLRGWNPKGPSAAIHDLTEKDLRVRSVPTNIRKTDSGLQSLQFGNSVFIFEVGDLCVAHLGHLHHTLTTQQLAQVGQMDVVFVPIDDLYTLDTVGVFKVLRRLKPRIVVPMHYFSSAALSRFLDLGRADYEIVRQQSSSMVISREQLPARPKVVVQFPGG
ncbi:MAG: MBL fold metallo-hydrolase [Hyphomicrobiaceae bacterium]